MADPTPSAENDAPLVERVRDRHFPWDYTAFGVGCVCGRPCDSNEECAVVLRARRWTRPLPPGEGNSDG